MSEAEVDQVARHGFKPGAASDRCWFLPSTPASPALVPQPGRPDGTRTHQAAERITWIPLICGPVPGYWHQ
jgi:hypothetical protein